MSTKANFIARLSEATGLTRRQVSQVLAVADTLIYSDLLSNGVALVPGLGKLKVQSRGARQGRNPRTGESLTIPARRVVKFSATRGLKNLVAEASGQ